MTLPEPYYSTELGTLYCGDCLEIMPHLPKVDFLYTDPPYNVGKNYGTFKDDLDDVVYIGNMKNKIVFFNRFIIHIPKKYIKEYLNFLPKGNIIILVRPCAGSCLFPNKWRDDFDILYSVGKTACGYTPSNVWSDVKMKGTGFLFKENDYGHPGYTPISICEKSILVMTVEKEIVCDIHMGTGTTAVACEHLNRRWIGIEISEEYCEIAKQRLEKEVRQGKLFPVSKFKSPTQEELFL